MKISTKLSMAALVASSLLLPLQASAEMKIGVLDMRTVMTQSAPAKNAMEKLKKEFKTREDQLVSTDKSLKEKADKLQRNAAVMSEAEKTKLEREVVAGQRDLQRLQNDFREDAGVRQQEETKKLFEKINKVVDDIAKKEKYDLIIHKDVAPYTTQQLDITDKVMKAISTSA